MFCKHCGKEISDDSAFCSACGKATTEIGQVTRQNLENKQLKRKCTTYSKLLTWLFIIAFILVSCTAVFSGNSDEVPEQPTISEAEFKGSCREISYNELARNPDNFKGNRFKFTGKVIQAISNNTVWNLRINVTPIYSFDGESINYYEDTIYAIMPMSEDGTRILEGDIITIYGTCSGLFQYNSVLGNEISLPGMEAFYFEFAQ